MTPVDGTGRLNRKSIVRDCRRTISAASSISAGKSGLDFYRHGIQRLAEQDTGAGYIGSLHADGC